jgi:hypothetical protein
LSSRGSTASAMRRSRSTTSTAPQRHSAVSASSSSAPRPLSRARSVAMARLVAVSVRAVGGFAEYSSRSGRSAPVGVRVATTSSTRAARAAAIDWRRLRRSLTTTIPPTPTIAPPIRTRAKPEPKSRTSPEEESPPLAPPVMFSSRAVRMAATPPE